MGTGVLLARLLVFMTEKGEDFMDTGVLLALFDVFRAPIYFSILGSQDYVLA